MIGKNKLNCNDLNIEVMTNEKRFDELENDWNSLIANCKRPSIYSSFIYVKTAWEHFRNKKRDRLFIIILKIKTEIVAIASLRIETYKSFLLPVRVVRFISEWNGDRPSLITCVDEKIVWERIINYLQNDFGNWDILDLAEQTQDSGIFDLLSKKIKKQHSKITYETTSYYISCMNWEEYFKKFSEKTRKEFKRKEKKLFSLSPTVELQCYSDPEDIQRAFNRYIEIEKGSWKKEAHFCVGIKSYQRNFYQDLFLKFAEHNMISIYFLRVGKQDISGQIIYHFKDIAYSAHTAYRKDYSKYSPGIELKKMVLKHLMRSGHFREIDKLGMHKKYRGQETKKLFSTNKRETYRIRILRSKIRLFFIRLLASCSVNLSKVFFRNKYKTKKQEMDFLFPK